MRLLVAVSGFLAALVGCSDPGRPSGAAGAGVRDAQAVAAIESVLGTTLPSDAVPTQWTLLPGRDPRFLAAVKLHQITDLDQIIGGAQLLPTDPRPELAVDLPKWAQAAEANYGGFWSSAEPASIRCWLIQPNTLVIYYLPVVERMPKTVYDLFE